MWDFEDLVLGQVKLMTPRGHGEITLVNTTDTETVWFHYGDGRYTTIQDNQIEWGGETDGYNRLRLPQVDDYVVFEDDFDGQGRPKASPWTYAQPFWTQCVEISSRHFRIMEDDRVIWEGSYSPVYQTRLTGGRIPESIDTIQEFVSDDIWEGADGSRGEIPGEWVQIVPASALAVLDELMRATRYPLRNASLPPAMR